MKYQKAFQSLVINTFFAGKDARKYGIKKLDV